MIPTLSSRRQRVSPTSGAGYSMTLSSDNEARPEVEVIQADIDLARLCVPAAAIFADSEEHVADMRRRAAEHIARHRLSCTSHTVDREALEVERLKLQLAESREMVAKLAARNSKLAGAVEANPPISIEAGTWWYPEGDTSSDECRYSPGEVVDYATEGMAEGESRVVVIERALHLPDIYAAVHVFTEQEKDARGRDDDSDFSLHATLEAAQAMLSANPLSPSKQSDGHDG